MMAYFIKDIDKLLAKGFEPLRIDIKTDVFPLGLMYIYLLFLNGLTESPEYIIGSDGRKITIPSRHQMKDVNGLYDCIARDGI